MRESAEWKGHDPGLSIYGVISPPMFRNKKFLLEHISESFRENQMKLDILRDSHKK